MRNFRRTVSVLSAAAIASCMTSIAAFADNESDMLSKDEIIEYVWNDLYDWDSGDDGTVYAEGSYKHNLLVDWVDEYYGKDVSRVSKYYEKDAELDTDYYEWADLDRVCENYQDYLGAFWKDYSDHDDDNGNYYLSASDSSDVLYRFEFIGGMWNMIDTNGNTVDTFSPFSTLEEEDSSSSTDTSDESSSGETAEATGAYYSSETTAATVTESRTSADSFSTETAVAKARVIENVTEENTSDNSDDGADSSSEATGSHTGLIIGGAAVLALGAAAVVAYRKKK